MKLKEFISALQNGVLSANTMLQKHNLEYINFYFETRKKASRHEKDSEEPTKPLNIYSSPKDTLSINSLLGQQLYPKTVSLIFVMEARDPNNGEMYLKNHEVIVPLMALVPYNQIGIHSMKLSMDIALSEDTKDQETKVMFPQKGVAREEEKVGSLEINFEKISSSEGLKKVLEGYERLLRAQIPG